ncbi:hypothetical protein RvY_07960 [Ramazzottius varieornatus]|uniref:UBX domain-containing protein n=1 Tax=Ramazzottius varieornatus TaxID=947166 RepID=A0A1D1V455_RAMVA|nr:hypothetical protein RvY_07960 [Ramazzottius varieornatus]
MSALKKFFDKVKKDTKFKKAGEGRSLRDEDDRPRVRPEVSHSQASVSAPRKTNVDSNQKAAQAALARLESKMGAMGHNANLLKEVYTEMGFSRVEVEGGTGHVPSSSRLANTSEAAEHPVLSVEGIFYKCPVIGPFVLPRDEMEKRIQEFLKEQYAVDPTIASAVMLATFNKDTEKLDMGRETLLKYLNNIIEHPEEEKYRKIRVGNKAFQERVLALTGAEKFLEAAGFHKVPLPHEGNEEDFYVIFPEENTVERLKMMAEFLEQAEPVMAELDRGLRVFKPSGRVTQFNLPDAFYDRSSDEVQDEYKRRLTELEKNQTLRTKAMREMDKRPARKYRFTILRIRIPGPDGGYILQGTFGAYEKISAVVEFVRENMINEQLPFVLTTAVGNKLTNLDARLNELDLVPAAVMNFQSLLPAPPSGRTSDLQLLKEETLAMIQPAS